MDADHTGALSPTATGTNFSLFTTITELTGDGLCLIEMITDAEGKPVDYFVLEANDLFETLTGLHDVVGKTGKQLTPELEEHWVENYARVGLGRETLRFENPTHAIGRWFEVNASPAPTHGQLFIFFRDITERKRAEEERQAALDQANRLLAEINHRVKNSLAIINSVLSLEKRAADETSKAVIERIGFRVDAVRALYASLADTGSISEVDSSAYLTGVIEGLKGAVARGDRITVTHDIDSFSLSPDKAISLGLVVNELVTNAVKHAFEPDAPGKIDITLTHEGETALMTIEDDGGQHSPAVHTGSGGLGSRLIVAFVENLGATMETEYGATGTRVTLRF